MSFQISEAGVDPFDDFERKRKEEMTASEIYKLLIDAWNNERNCPDLLKYRNNLVECMIDQLNQMKQNLRKLSLDDFLIVPHKMEIDRIRYVTSSYLRVRLEKIERFAGFLLKRDRDMLDENDRYLSKAEFQFAEQYVENLENHVVGEVFRYEPVYYHQFEDEVDVKLKPNMNSVVVFKMLKSVEGYLVNGKPQSMPADICSLIPFKDVKMLIENGSAVCI